MAAAQIRPCRTRSEFPSHPFKARNHESSCLANMVTDSGFPQHLIDNLGPQAWNLNSCPIYWRNSLPYPSEKQSAERGQTPNPELNPMTNPTLGRNLGRWAEVYFTTPAERREQAVLELLRELEQVEQEHPDLVTASHVESPAALETPATNEHNTALEEIVRQFEQPGSLAAIDHLKSHMCPACQHANRPDQLYCGMCGYRLNTASASEPVGEQASPSEVREQRIAKNTEAVLPLFGSQPPYAQEPETVGIMDRTPLWPLHVEDEGRWGSTFKVIAVVAVLAAAALVFLYQRRAVSPSALTSVSSRPSAGPSPYSTEPVASTHAPARDSAGTATSPVAPLGESQKSEDPPTKSLAPTAPSPNVPEIPAHSADAAQSAAPARAQSSSLKTGVPTESGDEEFKRARELLAGRKSPPDAGQASVWLWKAVAKHNGPAVLLLADLYARGDGVPRSCDQARILLAAALKRGSVEANQKLQELQHAGCSER